LRFFDLGYVYLPIFDRLNLALVFDYGLNINVTVTSDVDSVKFVAQKIIGDQEEVSWVYNVTDGCFSNFNIPSGLYNVTVYAYDKDENELDNDSLKSLLISFNRSPMKNIVSRFK